MTRARSGPLVAVVVALAACGGDDPTPAGSGGATGSGASGGEGPGGAGGGSTFCVPGEVTSCYTGPTSTQGIGECASGTSTCLEDGSAFGACIGEVTPVAEACDAPGDEDCDGVANEAEDGCVCVPGVTQPCYPGPAGTQDVGICASGMKACDASGTAFGTCAGAVVPSVEVCWAASDEDCDGAAGPACTGCSVLFDGASPDAAVHDVAINPSGAMFVVGGFHDTLTVGGINLTAANNSAFVAKLDASCNVLWAKAFVSPVGSSGNAVATDAAGNVFVSGGFKTGIDFGGSTLTSVGEDDVYLAKLDPAGAPMWSKRFGDDGGDQFTMDAAVDANGGVAITGVMYGSADFGGGTVTGNWFVASFAGDGTHRWSKASGGRGGAVAFDDAGTLVLAGAISTTADFGGGTFANVGDGDDAFIGKFSPTGEPLWGRTFVNDQNAGLWFSIDAAFNGGDVVTTGSFIGSLDAGGGFALQSSDSSLFVARLSGADGSTSWAEGFATAGSAAVVSHSNGDIGISGVFSGSIDFGGGALVGGILDGFLARLSGTGAHVASASFGAPSFHVVEGAAVGPNGAQASVGWFEGTLDFGFGPISATAMDGYLVRWNP